MTPSLRRLLTHDIKVKLLQGGVYFGGLTGILAGFDKTLLAAGLAVGWLLFLVGVSCSLHKYSAHRAYRPKPRYRGCLLLAGTLCALGSNICWASTHRRHHSHTDCEGDPHRPLAGRYWHNVKLWFYYFQPHQVTHVNDLMRDPLHRWFHRHYFHIHLGVIFTLYVINPTALVYFYCLPIIYVMTAISWITVCDHLPSFMAKFWRDYDTPDYTYNSKLLALFLPGEGYHNTHHARPGKWDTGPWDLSAKVIRLIT